MVHQHKGKEVRDNNNVREKKNSIEPYTVNLHRTVSVISQYTWKNNSVGQHSE